MGGGADLPVNDDEVIARLENEIAGLENRQLVPHKLTSDENSTIQRPTA